MGKAESGARIAECPVGRAVALGFNLKSLGALKGLWQVLPVPSHIPSAATVLIQAQYCESQGLGICKTARGQARSAGS